MMKKNKGQGALEYLLLIGGAVLIAVIVIALLVGMGGQNKSNIETQNKKATDVLSAPTPPTITSVAVIGCTAGAVGADSFNVRVVFTEAVADTKNITYKAYLYDSTGNALLSDPAGIIIVSGTSADLAGGASTAFIPVAADCDTITHAYSIEVVAEAISAAGQTKSASSMKNNFVFP